MGILYILDWNFVQTGRNLQTTSSQEKETVVYLHGEERLVGLLLLLWLTERVVGAETSSASLLHRHPVRLVERRPNGNT
jgi:hypothetical protein